mgnify:CR=1 FL=1
MTAPLSPLVSFSMAGDFPPKSDDDLTGIVRGDIGEPIPLSSPDLALQPDLVASLSPWQSPLRQASLAALPRAVSPTPLSPWESPLRQAVNASQLRGSSARGLPSNGPTRAAEPEKPVTPGFAVWRSPAMFGSPRVQSDAEAPSPPVVSGVQDGLVRRATQTASRAILGAGAVDGLVATRNEKKPTPREPWQEPLVTGSTCPGKTNTMDWISSLARGDASGSCGCSPCQGGTEVRKDLLNGEINSVSRDNKNEKQNHVINPEPSRWCAGNNAGRDRKFAIFGSGTEVNIRIHPKNQSNQNVINSRVGKRSIRPPNAQPEAPGEDEVYPQILFENSRIVHDPGGWSRSRQGILIEHETPEGPVPIRVITTGPWRKFCYQSQRDRNFSKENSYEDQTNYNIGMGESMDDLEFQDGYLVKKEIQKNAEQPRRQVLRKFKDV